MTATLAAIEHAKDRLESGAWMDECDKCSASRQDVCDRHRADLDAAHELGKLRAAIDRGDAAAITALLGGAA